MHDILLQGIVGSHAYGLAHENSDIDRLAINRIKSDAFLSMHGVHDRDLTSTSHSANGDDITIHEVGKFCRLALQCNPTLLELLWLPEHLLEINTDEGAELIALREGFLCANRVRSSYLGYARQQLERAIASGKNPRRREKAARHLYRLVHQGVSLHRTGHLELHVPDRDETFTIGELAATGDITPLRALLTWADEQFAQPTALPHEPHRALIEDYVLRTRTQHTSC